MHLVTHPVSDLRSNLVRDSPVFHLKYCHSRFKMNLNRIAAHARTWFQCVEKPICCLCPVVIDLCWLATIAFHAAYLFLHSACFRLCVESFPDTLQALSKVLAGLMGWNWTFVQGTPGLTNRKSAGVQWLKSIGLEINWSYCRLLNVRWLTGIDGTTLSFT